MAADNETQEALTWHEPDAERFRISGLAWYEKEKAFRRLPRSAKESVRPDVDHLAEQTAGGQVAFRSNSTKVSIKIELAGPADMDHMPPTGQCGCDLYLGDPHQSNFHSVVRYGHTQDHYESVLFEHSEAVLRSFTINLPLYMGIKRAQIGLDAGAAIEAPYPWSHPGSVVVYGTSIVQGGCASRPGMLHTNILSRMLDMEFINLGFSGNGRGEPEVMQLVAAVPNAQVFILDYEANSWIDGLKETLPVAIDIIREQHPTAPILVLSRIPFAKDLTHQSDLQHREQCRDYQAQLVDERQRDGDGRISFLDGITLLGPRADECTVDGVHPTDLGFSRMASSLYPIVKALLPGRSN